MTWSYNIASGLPKDLVRLYIGDTSDTDPQLQDEEIGVYVADNPGSPLLAAANCCVALQAKFARQVSKTLGQMSISASDRVKAYEELATQLRTRAMRQGGLVPMEVGGMTYAEKNAIASQSGLVQPSFRRGEYDLPGNGDTDNLRYPASRGGNTNGQGGAY